jgi:hypothetical protein
MKKRISLTGALLLSLSGFLNSQTFINPNYSLKSHETLDIVKVEVKPGATIFYMDIENRIVGGNFCADKNVYIIYPDGKKSMLESSSGIPVCPETYKFKAVGEKLEFVLRFPPLKEGTKWIDLIEDCSNNCFSFYGLTLDPDLNKRIDDAFFLAENEEPAKALISFINLAEEIDKNNRGIEGLLYLNIIKFARETGDSAKAEKWYQKLKLSDTPRLAAYIKYLNNQGIKY